ncbi:phage tail assembly chaperone [Photobacterium damselae]|uniref:tail fiber assembly protein n=1 Tax=Photobacterium damselae TaxID=38293 RepID=UPI001EDCADEF|nr:tail fiber assembly protein [Photobacterium damselae]MCG3811180.1 phage tail assembly chaperone [Photobacterium damselae]
MIISFIHNGKSYVNYHTESDAFETLDILPDKKIEIVTEAKWERIRVKREPLMRDTDWTQMPDAPLSVEKKAEFTAYRQALRDIPQTYDNPDDVIWPAKPTL